MKFILNIAFIFLFLLSANSQVFDISDLENDNDSTTEIDESIDFYDKYNPVFGGDSIRYRKGVKCMGQVKDFYPSGKLKHKGIYDKGKLTIYKNYYENGQLERSFKVKGSLKHILELYYKDGKLKSKVDYFKKEELIWQDFFPDGKMEFYEEYDKSFDFYISLKFFYENGNPQNILELIEKKKRLYDSKEYYENGKIKEEGKIIHNIALNDYQKVGIWKIYDEIGKLIAEEEYVKGRVINDKKF